MKKIMKAITYIALSVLMLVNIAMTAWAASASMSGTQTVRAGDTITVNLYINDKGKYGLEGTLSYDSSQVTLNSAVCNVTGWTFERNGNQLIMYDDAMSNPINGNVNVVTFSFTVKSNVATGSNINISVKNLVATDGSAESNLGTATYKVTVAKPLSTNANLKSLSVTGYTLSPAFAAGTTSYDIGKVPFSVSSLDIKYATEDAGASVYVSGNNLAVGANTVSVVVTAENGGTKTYSIKVEREQDPNYVASNDATLSSIKPSVGQLSPSFNSAVTEYVIYLPYEAKGKEFSATATTTDSKAQGAASDAIAALVEGENKLDVTCIAEDGTKQVYKLTVVVMPEYTGLVPDISGVEKEPETEEPSTEAETQEPETETEAETEPNVKDDEKSGEVAVLWVVIIALIAAVAGCAIGYFIGHKPEKKGYAEEEEIEIGTEYASEEEE